MSVPTKTDVPSVSRRPGVLAPATRVFAYWMTQYRRTWRGSAFTSVLEPMGYLAAMGIGLGVLVDEGPGASRLGGVTYLEFLAPALLAAAGMQSAAGESMYPVLGAIKWHRTNYAMLAAPLRVVDVLTGHLLFVVFRIVLNLTVFLGVMFLFDAVATPWAVLAMPVAVLTGLAHATPIFAFSATQENGDGFAMVFRFAIIPMFLFSGTFFPVSQLPDWIEPIAWITPLWHGVDLCRDLALGEVGAGSATLHLLYLTAWVVGGFLLALSAFKNRLEK